MDPEEKRFRDQQKKGHKKLEEDVIKESRSLPCCSLKCCQNTTFDDFKEIRSEYWGASFANRRTHMLALFHNRSKEMIRQNMMLLKSRLVCKKGFYQIFGLSHAGFYNYENSFNEGQKVGFHGNEGQYKSRENTALAKALLENILRATGEPMPHLVYYGGNWTDDIEYKLPSSMTKKCVYGELKTAMSAQLLSPISFSTFHSLWNKNYANYNFHASSAFSKCDDCSRFKEGLQSERRAKEREDLERKRAIHLQQQMSRRHIYYSARIRAKQEPHNYLCIIHDKMDQKKTWLPRMANTPKSLAGRHNPLPISLTGMIIHGRDPGAYSHYGLTGLWASDPDFTITFIAKCLRDLEEYCGDKSGHLGNMDVALLESHPIFRQLLDQKPFEAAYLIPKNITVQRFRGIEDQTDNIVISAANSDDVQQSTTASTSSVFKPLPKHLVLQMDNSAKDNKNQTMMAFCSDLVARGIFETVTMSFLMVGHTHEDIDAAFSKVSLRTRGKHIGTLPELMAEVWECMEELHMVPSLITEVATYKTYLEDHKVKNIVGHSAPVSFRFSMIDNRPVYQYKENINSPWIPEKGRCIWAIDPVSKKLMVPIIEPNAKNMCKTYDNKDDVVPYIRKYIEHHGKNCVDESSEAYRTKFPLTQYWKNVADMLEGEFGFDDDPNGSLGIDRALPKLSYQFWPKTNHGTGYKCERQSMDNLPDMAEPNTEYNDLMEEMAKEVRGRNEMFVGCPSEKERLAWNPLEDIKEGSFVILNPNQYWEEKHGK